MKESITKFDLEAAFKALDEIDIPATGRVKANKPALTEIFSHKTKFDALMEEYYDVNDVSELDDAKNAREAEVAQAKLARIEKIVDLDAESPEDLLPSYVGKFIMQCPQCMTLFYKDPEDIEASEEDPDVVNVAEVCQHCGNESGYTLIGKVGAATEEEMSDYTQEETVDVTSTEEDEELEIEEEPTEDSTAEDLDLDLDDIDLELEDDEAEEKTEESFANHDGQPLVEELTEEVELDVSAEDFEKLIKSPEFKRPISDSDARAMMDELDSDKKDVEEGLITEASIGDTDDILSDNIAHMMHAGKFLYASWVKDAPTIEKLAADTYKVTHHKGGTSVVVKFDMSNLQDSTLKFTVNGKPFATQFANEAQDFVIAELESARVKSFDLALDEGIELEEGVFDKIKDKLANTIDKATSKLKSREGKANWVLKYALKDYDEVKINDDGEIDSSADNKRFNTFVVVGYEDTYTNGKEITSAPAHSSKDLVVGMKHPEVTDSYEKADKIAKGWSLRSGNGPAHIYLAKSAKDEKAMFVCNYFKGELVKDYVEDIFEKFKADLKGAKLMKRGGANQSETKKVKASEIKPGMLISLKDGITGKVEKVDEARLGNGLILAVGFEDGVSESFNVTADFEVTVLKSSLKNESIELDSFMDNVEELHEATLERLISDSLVESYGNVAGFRLAECAYDNNKLTVDGTIYFTSGNTRKTSYSFTEAYSSKENKVSLRGLNEKLGLDKYFTITGCADESKTFITESFTCTKK